MTEDPETRPSRYGPNSKTLEQIQAVQAHIRAASTAQRQRAAKMREQAAEVRAHSRAPRCPQGFVSS